MTLQEAVMQRHSVRRYLDTPIEEKTAAELEKIISEVNAESGLSLQLVLNEPKAFGALINGIGFLKNVRNYIALVGKNGEELSEKAGYYGEKIVLEAQRLGLNTCWVAGTYRKEKTVCRIKEDESLVCVIALGCGENQGKPHNSKPLEKLYKCEGEVPEWFLEGVRFASLAPTALNQQKFLFEYSEEIASVKSLGGFYSDIDLGIVKYHFEIGSGRKI